MKRNTYLLLLIGALALMLISAWIMYRRFQVQELWAYWPQVLFLSSLGVLVLLRAHKTLGDPTRSKWLGWSLLSGLLLGLAFPDRIPVGGMIFVAWVPLLRLEKALREGQIPRSGRILAGYSYYGFVLWNVLATYWVANASLMAGLFAILVNSALMLLPWVLSHAILKKMPGLGYLPLMALWLAFEYFHHRWELNWPWLTLGNSLADFPSWLQWYSYTGVLGGSLWILLVNIAAFEMTELRLSGQKWQPALIRLLFIGLAPLALSLVWYSRYSEQGKAVEAVVVQPNYEPHYEKRKVPEEAQAAQMAELARRKASPETRYFVFPESSIGYADLDQLDYYVPYLSLRDLLDSFPNASMVFGLDAYRFLKPDEPDSRFTRTQRNALGQAQRFEVMNAAVQTNAAPGPVQVYRKSKLVPGPEIFPYPKLFGFLKPVMERFGGTLAGFASQPERGVFAGPAGKVGPVICYESAFGEFLTGYVRHGAEAIFIVTNDGWWDNTAGHRQHLRYASLRAIESRRDIARAASTGISAFIDQRGKITQPTRYGEAVAIKGTIHLSNAVSFYVRWGDMIGRLAAAISAILLLNLFVKSITGKA